MKDKEQGKEEMKEGFQAGDERRAKDRKTQEREAVTQPAKH